MQKQNKKRRERDMRIVKREWKKQGEKKNEEVTHNVFGEKNGEILFPILISFLKKQTVKNRNRHSM